MPLGLGLWVSGPLALALRLPLALQVSFLCVAARLSNCRHFQKRRQGLGKSKQLLFMFAPSALPVRPLGFCLCAFFFLDKFGLTFQF